MRPTSVVSSANLAILTDGQDVLQSLVNKEYYNGERTQPWGAPVFKMRTFDNKPLNFTI